METLGQSRDELQVELAGEYTQRSTQYVDAAKYSTSNRTSVVA